MILSTSAWLQNILMEKKNPFFFFHFGVFCKVIWYEPCEKQCWVVPTLELIECNLLWCRTHFYYEIIKATAKRTKKEWKTRSCLTLIDDHRWCKKIWIIIATYIFTGFQFPKSVPYHNVRENWGIFLSFISNYKIKVFIFILKLRDITNFNNIYYKSTLHIYVAKVNDKPNSYGYI